MRVPARRVEGVQILEGTRRHLKALGHRVRRGDPPVAIVVVPAVGRWVVPTATIIDSFAVPLRLPAHDREVPLWLIGHEVYAVSSSDATPDEVIRLRGQLDAARRRAAPDARSSA